MKSLLALLFLAALFISTVTGCKENPATPNSVVIPAPPTNLHYDTVGQAIQLHWTASVTSPDSIICYLLTISGRNDTISIAKNISSYSVTGLLPGTKYTLTLRTKGINNQLSAPASVVISTSSYPTLPPPTGLMANSADFQTVRLKWTSSAAATDVKFLGYELTVTPNGGSAMPTITIAKTATMYEVSGLTEGTIYTFSLKARSSDSANSSSTAATVRWSPAMRINNVRLYETASSHIGSGFNFSSGKVLKVSNIGMWDIGLDTRAINLQGIGNVTSYDIGSPNLTSYTLSKVRTTLVSSKRYENVNSLDEVFDTHVLGPNAPLAPEAERLITFYRDKEYILGNEKFPLVNANSHFLFFAKTEEGNYAKILVKSKNGVILQGTAPDRYIEMDISYQTAANIPYALTGNSEKPAFKTVNNSSAKKASE